MPDTMAQTRQAFVPIYSKDGNEFAILQEDFVAHTEEDAQKIGLGTMLVECILMGMKFERVQEIDTKRLPHIPAMLGNYRVAIIAGPDGPDPTEAAQALEAETSEAKEVA
jgi:hypothetical protein